MLARYADSDSKEPSELYVTLGGELDEILIQVDPNGGLVGSAIEFVGNDGSVLVLAVTERGGVIGWTDLLGDSIHSVGAD